MKAHTASLLTASALAAALFIESPPVVAQSPGVSPASFSFAGTWEGQMGDSSQIDLNLHESGGKVRGTVLYYRQVGAPLPLLAPRVEGKTLTFEVERHQCESCAALASNAGFRMELTGTNQASLWRLDDQDPNETAGPEVKFVRQNDSASWRDPSPHQVQFVIVEYGVRLEVLDWGGTGRPVVLLAGSGNTAHIFDGFAPKLTGFCHVYGVTRRGYGQSSHPDAGYTEHRLAEDVLQVIDALRLLNPVLVGHSAGGEELTRLGDEHSDRLGGLVYLDAAFDPADLPASSPAYMALFRNLPAAMRDHPGPSASDRKSFHSYREWQQRDSAAPFPESELRNMFATNADGSVGDYKASTPFIHDAIGAGALPRDYSGIHVPVLAFFGMSCSKHPPADYACIEHPARKAEYQPKNAEELAAKEAFDSATAAYVDRWKENMQHVKSGLRIVDLPGANHYIFLSNEADVLRELRVFIAALH